MSFFSDKDVRKGAVQRAPPKRPTGTGATVSGGAVSSALVGPGDRDAGDNVAERARIERERRQANRELSVHAVKVQAWWRGRSASARAVAAFRADVDKKLADVEKLGAVLLATKKVAFVPPLPICVDLARKLTALGYAVGPHGRSALPLTPTPTPTPTPAPAHPRWCIE